jgi:uncharacterized protein YgiM (DUF1202 family)
MSLQDKYANLIATAQNNGTNNLAIREQDGILYINGEVASGEIKDKLWNVYNQIDPDFRAGDLIMDIDVSPNAPFSTMKVTTQSSNLNIRKGPGTDTPIIGKAAHNSTVTFLSKYNDQWYLIRNEEGKEGYCSTDYLTAL